MNSNWSYSPETLNSGKNQYFLSRVTLKFDGWHWKTIGHILYASSSFVHNFIAISESRLELQSGRKRSFGSKSMIYVPCDLEIWQITLKNSFKNSWKSQHGSNILSTHIPLIPCQLAIPFLRYAFFKIWPWKSKVKVMSEVDIESHKMGPTFYRLTSL